MPGVSSQLYHNGPFSIEIPFAFEGSNQAAVEVKQTNSLANDHNCSQSSFSNPCLLTSRKRNRASAATYSASYKSGSKNQKKAAYQLTDNNSSQACCSLPATICRLQS